jgi:hypothetical protein
MGAPLGAAPDPCNPAARPRWARRSRARFPCRAFARYVQTMAHRLETRAVLDAACASLLEAALGPGTVDMAEVRDELTEARRLGLDWRRLYEEAVAQRPVAWGPAPLLEDVSPERSA